MTGTLYSLASLFMGAPPLGKARSGPGLGSSIFSGTCGIACQLGGNWWWLLQSGPGARLGSPQPGVGVMATSPQFTCKAFGPAQERDHRQNGSRPAARELPSLLKETLLPPGAGQDPEEQCLCFAASGRRGSSSPQSLQQMPCCLLSTQWKPNEMTGSWSGSM